MKKGLKAIQEFLDSDRTVPEDLLNALNRKDRILAENLILFKSSIRNTIESEISEDPQVFKIPKQDQTKGSRRPGGKFLLAALLLSAVSAFFPLYSYIGTRALIKEETSEFVEELFRTIEPFSCTGTEITITENWFDRIFELNL